MTMSSEPLRTLKFHYISKCVEYDPLTTAVNNVLRFLVLSSSLIILERKYLLLREDINSDVSLTLTKSYIYFLMVLFRNIFSRESDAV